MNPTLHLPMRRMRLGRSGDKETFFEMNKKIDFAINLIRKAAEIAEANGSELEVCYSGGKDSDVILHLAQRAGVKFDAIYKNTTIDPPGTIAHAEKKGVRLMKAQVFAQEMVED
jgi:phosphoadenosine phosphosulfate reductase